MKASSFAAILLVVVSGGCSEPVDRALPPIPDAASEAGVKKLIGLQKSPKKFSAEIDALLAARDQRSLIVLTYALVQLPWPFKNDDEADDAVADEVFVPKLSVEEALDDLVGEKMHENLSAAYFRSLVGDGDEFTAKRNLLEWTLENRSKLVSDGKQLVLEGEAEK